MNNNMVSIIVAMDEKRGIGKNNDLLFRIPEDSKRVRILTDGHPLVMGRRTFESLGRLLPNRSHIVVTRDQRSLKNISYQPHAAAATVKEGVEIAKKYPGSEEIFIFGGGQIYTEALKQGLVDKLFLTVVKGDYKADTFFPEYPGFKVIHKEDKKDGEFEYEFVDLVKE